MAQTAKKIVTNTITVCNGKQFANLTDAINSITNNEYYNRYTIEIHPGKYPERIILKPYVGILGTNRDSVIFEWNRPTSTSNADVTSQSMVEMHDDGCFIKNITVKGANFRYMVHTEFSDTSDKVVEIENCYIKHNDNDSLYSWAHPHALGVGLGKNNTKLSIKNSTLFGATDGRGVLVHYNASPTGSSYLNIENSNIFSEGGTIYEGLNLDNYGVYSGSIPWFVTLNNNKIQSGVLVSGSVNRAKISGSGNAMQRYYDTSTNWVDGNAESQLKNPGVSIISRGTAVELAESERTFKGVFNGTNYNNYSRFVGFAVNDILAGEIGAVVNKGSLVVKFSNSVNYLDEVMLNSNGTVSKYDSFTANRRFPIGQLLQPSAAAGDYRRIIPYDNVKTVLPPQILTRGSNMKKVVSNGYPSIVPDYLGQFWHDIGTTGGVYLGIDTAKTGADGWKRLDNA